MTLPALTPRQTHIITLLYRYRFLNRIQIQDLMGHKDYRRINAWLADLRSKEYVGWIYETDFTQKSQAAIYYLKLNGLRWIKQRYGPSSSNYHHRYREADRTREFIDQCLLLADCCRRLDSLVLPDSSPQYLAFLSPDLADPEHGYHFLAESDLIHPALVYKSLADSEAPVRLLEIIPPTLPRYRVRKRLKNYIQYLSDGEWQDDTDSNLPNPLVLFVCPSLTELIYCKRATKRLLEDYEDEAIAFYFTTVAKVRAAGLVAPIWEEVRAPQETGEEPAGEDYEEDDDDDEY